MLALLTCWQCMYVKDTFYVDENFYTDHIKAPTHTSRADKLCFWQIFFEALDQPRP